MLMSCSNGAGSEVSHRTLSEICKKVLKMEMATVSLGIEKYILKSKSHNKPFK